MKLEKYEDKSKKNRKAILISLGVIVLINISFLLYKTFASFSENVEFPIMKGQVDYFGNSDVYFAFYYGKEKLEEMPKKDNTENLAFKYGECDNGAYIIWDSEEWAPLVKNLNKSKTKCSLYFDKAVSIVDYITNLAKTDSTNLMYDGKDSLGEELGTEDNNLRYVGTDPNNYIDIGDSSLWRIIGVMKNITNAETDNQEDLIKIIRLKNIGAYSWDSSISTVNNGKGVNEWSDADLMKLLNPSTVYNGTSTIGGSLYWNRGSGNCYIDRSEANISCDFTKSGISDIAKKKIVKVKWNTGTAGEAYYNEKMTAKYMYEAERSNHNGQEQCLITGEEYTNGNCNDEVERKSTWDGYIGLMYPSDYGYAIGGNIRNECLAQSMYMWENCNLNNWMKINNYSVTITSVPHPYSSVYIYCIENSNVVATETLQQHPILPVAYLKSNTKIFNAKGTIDDPYVVS